VEQVGNREPTPEEMAFCLPFLRAQIEIVDPEIIVAVGATAAKGLLGAGTFRTLGEVRGQWKPFSGKPVMVTYHPSYLIRQQSMGPVPERKAKRAVWEDLLKVMERAGLTISEKQRGYFLEK
jgi:DNA polymerase